MSENSEIALTVLMPVYNNERYLKAAIDSIINQTFKNFEFLIINDGSTDNSDSIIASYQDTRIVYIHNKQNSGIVNTLNEGLSLSRGKYIARMDADDIAFPKRLETQLNYMYAHPECNLCGSQAIAINESGIKLNKLRRPVKNEEIKAEQLFRNCFIHPTVIFSRKVAMDFQYSAAYQYAEDFQLFSQITLKYEVANLKMPLLYYRSHDQNITSKKKVEMENSEKKVIGNMLQQLFHQDLKEDTIMIHHRMIRKDFEGISKRDFEFHLLSIKQINRSKKLYPSIELEKMLQKEWFNFLYRQNAKNKLFNFISSPLFSWANINFKLLFKLATK